MAGSRTQVKELGSRTQVEELGSRTQVEELDEQKPSGDDNSFPGPARRLAEQETIRERTQQELQVNMDRHDQGGGGGTNNGNTITATEVEEQPSGDSGLPRTQPELPQVNMDRHDQGGGGGIRNRIHNNNISADSGKNVGVSNCLNVEGQGGGQGGGLDISGNTITGTGGASYVGVHNVGNTTHTTHPTPDNTTPDRTCCIL